MGAVTPSGSPFAASLPIPMEFSEIGPKLLVLTPGSWSLGASHAEIQAWVCPLSLAMN